MSIVPVCANLLCAIKYVRGEPGELVVRIKALNVSTWEIQAQVADQCHREVNVSTTYFPGEQMEIERLNASLKRLWQKDMSLLKEMPGI